mgnify:FL=1
MDRFWAKVQKVQDDECWHWIGARRDVGYGALKINGRVRDAHRVSWELHYGEIPPGLYVMHTCDIRSCVNPKHLFVGTHKDNMADMLAKGRAPRGEANGNRKFTEQQISEIRKDFRPHKDIAKDYQVHRSTIGKIKSHKTWRHL